MMIRLIYLACVSCFLWTLPSWASPFDIQQHAEVQKVEQQSLLVFDPKELHLKDVLEGTQVQQLLLIRNTDHTTHRIVRIESSCGCTTAEPNTRILPAGGFTSLMLHIDTFGKTGSVKKTLTLVDEYGQQNTIFIHLHVKNNPHLMGSKRSIFDGDCGSCHFAPAAGTTKGADIYAAVCVMCHGAEGQGAYAPRLAGHHNPKVLEHLIAHGTGSTHMPAFSKKLGGPLTTRQINTLSRWIISLDD